MLFDRDNIKSSIVFSIVDSVYEECESLKIQELFFRLINGIKKLKDRLKSCNLLIN